MNTCLKLKQIFQSLNRTSIIQFNIFYRRDTMTISEKPTKIQTCASTMYDLHSLSLVSIFLLSQVTFANAEPTQQTASKNSCVYPNMLTSDCKTCKKEESPTLGVWGHFNRVFQEKISENNNPSPLIFPFSGNPLLSTDDTISLDKNSPSKVEKIQEEHERVTPHKAQYTISLDRNYDEISDANGEMSINIFDTGDGWVFEQNSTLYVYDINGEAEIIHTNLTTWQTYAGDRYRFNSRTVRNSEEDSLIKGEAVKNHNTRTTEVTYQLPESSVIQLPYDVTFPLHHLINTLESARQGLPSTTHSVFDGSNETYEAVTVDTILGAPKPSNLKFDLKNAPAINIQTKWPMRLAVYPLGSQAADPEYEMSQNVLGPGIIKDITLDYGSFAVKAELQDIVFYEKAENTPSQLDDSQSNNEHPKK